MPAPSHILNVERMQSGARRCVILDLQGPCLLTDIIIPACSDLVSLAVDVWTKGEEEDAVRLVVATDIATKSLVLTDLQPPPLCKFIKVNM